MKKATLTFILFVLISFINRCLAVNTDINKRETIIYSSSNCKIIEKYDENGNPLYWILAEIGNELLSEAGRFACVKILGEKNQYICDAIIEGFGFLSSVRGTGKKVFKLGTDLLEYSVEKRTTKSTFNFVGKTLNTIYDIKNTVEAYQKLGIINWNRINYDERVHNYNTNQGSITIENNTDVPRSFRVSDDGKTWKDITINAGRYKKIIFWEGFLRQNYGFIYIESSCKFQVFINKFYQIRYDRYEKKFTIGEK